MAHSIGPILRDLDVSNVFIYVGDAVRWDAIPDQVTSRGTAIKTIAASTYSPSSFASIVTGHYTPAHSVRTFSDQLPVDIPTIFDVGDDSVFLNSIFKYAERAHGESVDPIYRLLRRDPPPNGLQFGDLIDPFVAMERGPGGHAPYGEFTGTAMDYYRMAGSIDELRRDYATSVELDGAHFGERLDELDNAGLRDDTLVIYTSDHGELLGEGGMIGHNSPMRPELVYVPAVFIHPNIPAGTINTGSFHHVDLLPTILDVLGHDPDRRETFPREGHSLIDGVPTGPRPTVYDAEIPIGKYPLLTGSFRYDGAWSAEGGHTFARTALHERMAIAAAKLLTSSKKSQMRSNMPGVVSSYARPRRTFGTPAFSQSAAEHAIQESTTQIYDSQRGELSHSAKENLENLGYR